MSSPALQMVSLSIAMDDDMTMSTSSDDDDDTQEDYLLEASDLLGEMEGSTIIDDEALPPSYISAQRIAALRITHRRHDTDVGSPEYQVAGMTERIAHLTSHLKLHPKDFSTRRGLVALVNKRRRLLNYLFISNKSKYVDIVAALGIRHKVPGAIPSKEDEYGEFPKAKVNRGKSKMKMSGNKKK
jgi:small subunit ribosomal protein S15